jgi:hypothetical protein
LVYSRLQNVVCRKVKVVGLIVDSHIATLLRGTERWCLDHLSPGVTRVCGMSSITLVVVVCLMSDVRVHVIMCLHVCNFMLTKLNIPSFLCRNVRWFPTFLCRTVKLVPIIFVSHCEVVPDVLLSSRPVYAPRLRERTTFIFCVFFF